MTNEEIKAIKSLTEQNTAVLNILSSVNDSVERIRDEVANMRQEIERRDDIVSILTDDTKDMDKIRNIADAIKWVVIIKRNINDATSRAFSTLFVSAILIVIGWASTGFIGFTKK